MLGVHSASRFLWEQTALGLVHKQKTGMSWESGRGDRPWCGRCGLAVSPLWFLLGWCRLPSRSGVITDGLAVEPVPGSVGLGPCPLRFCSSAFSERLPVTSPVLSGSAHSLSAWRHALFLPLFPRGFRKQLDCSVCLFLLPVPTLLKWIKAISLRCS